jgi:hypothetical protein
MGSALALAIMGLMISFALVGITYMIGEVVGVDGFKGWYKSELSESVKSTLLVVIIFVGIFIAGGVALALAGSGTSSASGQTPALSGLSGLYTSVNSTYISSEAGVMTSSFSNMQSFLDGVGLANSTEINFWVPIPVFVIPITGTVITAGTGAVILPITNNVLGDPSKGFINSILTLVIIPMTLLFEVLYYMFGTIIGVGLGLLIPTGIVLRAIPFLRPMGGTLIAMGIGIAIIFPIVLLTVNLPVTNYISGSLFTSMQGSGTSSTTYTIASAIVPGGGIISTFISAAIAIAFPGSSGGTGSALFSQPLIAGFAGMFTGVYTGLNFVTYWLFNPLLQFLLIVADVIIVYTLSNNIARLLGGSITLGLGKFKLA